MSIWRKLSVVETKEIYRRTVVIMGAAGVGKTAIVEQFLFNRFPVNHKPTVEEMHSSAYDISGGTLTLNVIDTTGSYEFPEMRRLAIKTGDAFILVYAIDSMETFNTVSGFRELILETRQGEEHVPIVVVGNKCDLESSRVVSKDITESVVKIDWCCGFVESSAKEDINILQIFKTLLTQSGISHILGEAVERRRKSLPVQATYPKLKYAVEEKRPSCIIQ